MPYIRISGPTKRSNEGLPFAAGCAERDLCDPAPPIYQGAPFRRTHTRPCNRHSERAHTPRGRGAEPAESAKRMRVPSPLLDGYRRVSASDTLAAGGANWPLGGLHACAGVWLAIE